MSILTTFIHVFIRYIMEMTIMELGLLAERMSFEMQYVTFLCVFRFFCIVFILPFICLVLTWELVDRLSAVCHWDVL